MLRKFHLLLAAGVCAATLAQTAPPAAASAGQLSIMMDDNQLLYRGNNVQSQTLRRMKNLGVDYVRVTVLWEVVAENAKFRYSTKKVRNKKTKKIETKEVAKKVRGFNPVNPATYPAHNWDRYDQLVREAANNGIRVYFNVTGPGPKWAHAKAPKKQAALQRSWRPNAKEFYKFVKAVGTRYSGRYNDNGFALPRVAFWSLWNEPNQGAWLAPQAVRGRPVAPGLYRELFLRGQQALGETGHGRDFILMGETAPIGGEPRNERFPLRPALFYRELLCVDAAYRPKGGDGCGLLDNPAFGGGIRATGVAHHPYNKTLAPGQRPPHPDELTMGNVGDFVTLLDRLAAARPGKLAPGLQIVMSEYGYETDPPDPITGISLDQQAQWINEGDLIAYDSPRVAGMTQFLLNDVDPDRTKPRGSRLYWLTYQSGLFNRLGQPKPAAAAYAFPFGATASKTVPGALRLWGQLRFRPNGQAGDTVTIFFRPRGGAYAPVAGLEAVPVSNILNFFEVNAPYQGPGTYRAYYPGPGATTQFSREVNVP